MVVNYIFKVLKFFTKQNVKLLITFDGYNFNEGFSLNLRFSVNIKFGFLLYKKKLENTDGDTFYFMVFYYVCILSFTKINYFF